jgi:hypothetical protein
MSGNSATNHSRYWFVKGWPKALVLVGWILFWLAGVAGERVPLEALFPGPALMLAGVVMIVRNNPKLR